MRFLPLAIAVLALSAGAAQAEINTTRVPFDRAFIDAMIPHHQSAIAMVKEARVRALEPRLWSRSPTTS